MVAALVYWAYRNREKLGGGGQYAKDPVCGMQVERDNPGATTQHAGHTVYFCADRCKEKFVRDPARYTSSSRDDDEQVMDTGSAQATDPVCGMTVDVAEPGARATVGGRDYVFCGQGCADAFVSNPAAFVSGAESTQPAGDSATA